jgi:hypothetical protein
MSRDLRDDEFAFEPLHENAPQKQEDRAERAQPRLSPVMQLQRTVGNSRLLQLRARHAAMQARMSMEEATQAADEQASASFDAQRQAALKEPDISIPSGGQALPQKVQATAEKHLGVPLNDVQMVTNGDSATKPIQAQAFATEDGGTPKVVLSSDVDLNSKDGQFTLMHELAHVAQQKKGSTGALEGLGGDSGHREHLEHDADHHGHAMAGQLSKHGHSH